MARKESSRLVSLLSGCGSPTDHHSGSGTKASNIYPSCAHDDDRLRLPPASPAGNSKAGKKESTGRRLSQLCPPYATPSSNSSLDYRRSGARIVENGFAPSGGVSKSAKVVLEPVDIKGIPSTPPPPNWGAAQRHSARTDFERTRQLPTSAWGQPRCERPFRLGVA